MRAHEHADSGAATKASERPRPSTFHNTHIEKRRMKTQALKSCERYTPTDAARLSKHHDDDDETTRTSPKQRSGEPAGGRVCRTTPSIIDEVVNSPSDDVIIEEETANIAAIHSNHRSNKYSTSTARCTWRRHEDTRVHSSRRLRHQHTTTAQRATRRVGG